ncbi:f-box only protein 7 [Trichonephila inaurata madagascariensis]|uniref:F-box only protein 7 n=1 Tax=Trichonephila inaurata madagascariensis TaxID=2747483 RepID=A0A8X6XLC3_9ARAC|nr:f-box only protein 7 [Trichonephila inaurata madagascariensis]
MFFNETLMSQMIEDEVVSQEDEFPKGFLQLFSCVNIENSTEGLIILLHSYLLETGFVPKDVLSDVYKCMPENWKSSGIFKIQYFHVNIPETFCWVTWIPLYDNLAVHGTFENQELEDNVYIKLKTNSYVNTKVDLIDPHFLCNIEELSRIFKDGFCYTLLALLEGNVNRKPSFGFSGLIDELKLLILKLLPVESVVSLSCVNKDFYNQTNSPYLWKLMYIRDYGQGDFDSVNEEDWKEMYKVEYLKRKNRQRFRPLPMYNPCHFPHVFPVGPNVDVDFRIDMDPALQQAFPLMRSRFRPTNWFFPGGYQFIRRFW